MKWFCSLIETLLNTNNWSVDNVLSALSVILAIVGGFFAYRQWTAANKIKRGEFIDQIIKKLRFDKNIAKTMYMIDYDHDWYNESFHDTGSKVEGEVDKLFSYLSYICYLYDLKNISRKEFEILRYEINRVCSSHDAQSYLWILYHFSRAQKSKCSFQYLINYGIKNRIINKRLFYRKDVTIYPKYLNF